MLLWLPKLRLDMARGLCPLCAGSDLSTVLWVRARNAVASMLCPKPQGVLHAAVTVKFPCCAVSVGVCCLLAAGELHTAVCQSMARHGCLD